MTGATPAPIVGFSVFEVDLERRELRRHGRRVHLQDKPFELLTALLERPGGTWTREDLCARLWPGQPFGDFEAGLNTAVAKLRDALGDDAAQPRFIETVPRRGYRFIVPLAASAAAVPPPSTAAGDAASARPTSGTTGDAARVAEPAVAPAGDRRARRRWVVATASVALAVAGAGGLLLGSRDTERRPADGAMRSLAVLPFANLSGDAAQSHLADGVTESLTTELARVASLHVASRTSAMTYRDSRLTLPEIARSLGVESIVEGAVLRQGSRIQVKAQLIDARSDRHLWARSYDGDMAEILDLQARIAADVADTVAARTPSAGAAPRPRPRVDPAAYEAYLRGRYLLQQRTTESVRAAVAALEESVRRDPGFAPAHASLAAGATVYPTYVGGDANAMDRLAEREARLALAIDPGLGEAHAVLAQIQFSRWEWKASEESFRRAIAAEPREPTAPMWYGMLLVELGRGREAVQQMDRARQLDPGGRIPRAMYGWALLYDGRPEESARELRPLVAIDPSFERARHFLGNAYEALGDLPAARGEYEAALAASGTEPLRRHHRGHVAAVMGDRATLLRLAREAEEAAARGGTAMAAAELWSLAGEPDRAFAWLDRSFAAREWELRGVRNHQMLVPLHGDPRFARLVERLGLPPVPSAAASGSTRPL